MVLPFGVTVPVPLKVGTTAVYVPPVASVKLPEMFRVLAAFTAQVLPVKSMLLNQLFAVIVKVFPPAGTNKFGALDAEPPVVPKTSVAGSPWGLENPPVPVQVKPVAVAIASTVADVVLDRTMLPDPNAIDRVLVLDELKIPTVRLLLLSVMVPEVNVKVCATKQSVAEPDRDRLTTPPVGLAMVVLEATAVEATVTV
jgi:hypothetical protein